MTDQIEAARAALASAIHGRTGAQVSLDQAEQNHQRALSILKETSIALQAIVERQSAKNAQVSASVALAIRSGKAFSLDGKSDEDAAHMEASRRCVIAQGAVDELAKSVTAAAMDLQSARNAVDAAAKAVLIAERDALVADLKKQAAAFLDARHRLTGLMNTGAVPSTADVANLLGSIEPDYPPALHPQIFTTKAWNALQKALSDDPDAKYVPIAPSIAPEILSPALQRQRELRAAEDAERAANAKLNVERAVSANQLFISAERMHEFANRAAGG